MSPVTPHSIRGGDVFFSNWASGASSYPWNSSAASATSSHSPSVGTGITEIELSNLRSVSQIGEPPDASITGDASLSDISGSENTKKCRRKCTFFKPQSRHIYNVAFCNTMHHTFLSNDVESCRLDIELRYIFWVLRL